MNIWVEAIHEANDHFALAFGNVNTYASCEFRALDGNTQQDDADYHSLFLTLVVEITWMDEDLSLAKLDGLAKSTKVGPTAFVFAKIR